MWELRESDDARSGSVPAIVDTVVSEVVQYFRSFMMVFLYRHEITGSGVVEEMGGGGGCLCG